MDNRGPDLYSESARTFQCAGESLVGIAHLPERAASVGLLIIVGGPQYRVGSHRQFVLLARHLAAAGFPVFRFDFRGSGDSGGETRNFLELDDDIRSAIDAFQHACPDVRKVCLWGLCDAVPAALLYGIDDPRVVSMVLLNPWVRTEASLARAYFASYYLKRLFDRRAWGRILSSPAGFAAALAGAWHQVRSLFGRRAASAPQGSPGVATAEAPGDRCDPLHAPYRDWMRQALERFSGPVLFVLSGNDLTAAEFRDLVRSDRKWRKALARAGVECREISDANHTFSTRRHRDRVATLTEEWMGSL